MAVACAAAMVAVGSVRAAEVRNLRVWAGPEYTRAVFDVSGPADYKLFELAKPDRIVLDIHASTLGESFGAPAAKGLLKSIRAGKQGKDDARVVFDLEYMRKWTPLLDLQILVATAVAVVKTDRAY